MEQFPPVETVLYRTVLPTAVPFENFWGRKRKYFYGRSRKSFPENLEAYFGESHSNSYIVCNGPAFGTVSMLAEEANRKSNSDYFKSSKMQDTEHFEGEKQWDDFMYNCIGTISFLSPKNPNPDQSKVVRPTVESSELRRQKLKWRRLCRQRKQKEKEEQEKPDLSWESVDDQPVSSFQRGSFPKIRLRTNNQDESTFLKSFEKDDLASNELEDFDNLSLMKVSSESDENNKGRRNSRGNKKFKNKEGNKKNQNGNHRKQKHFSGKAKNFEQFSNQFQNTKKRFDPLLPENFHLIPDPWSDPPLSRRGALSAKIRSATKKTEPSTKIKEHIPARRPSRSGRSWGALSSNGDSDYQLPSLSAKNANWAEENLGLTTLPVDRKKNIYTMKPRPISLNKNQVINNLAKLVQTNLNYNDNLTRSRLKYDQNWCHTSAASFETSTNEDTFETISVSPEEPKFKEAFEVIPRKTLSKLTSASNVYKNTYFSDNGVRPVLPYIVHSTENWDSDDTSDLTDKTIKSAVNKETQISDSREENPKNVETSSSASKYEDLPKEDSTTTDADPKLVVSDAEPKETFKLSDIIGKISRRYIRGRRVWNGSCYTEDESSYRPFVQELLSKSSRKNDRQNGAKSATIVSNSKDAEDPPTVINVVKDPLRETVEEENISVLKQGKKVTPKKTVRFDTNANKVHEDTNNEVEEQPSMRKPVYSRGQIRGGRVLDCKPLL